MSRLGFKNVGVFMMQKNEDELLPIFVKYYGALFGYDNIHIFDNGSTEDTRVLLQQAEFLGANVDYEFNKPEHFERKGLILSDRFSELNTYDVFLPVDCDEFIGVKIGDQYSCSRGEVIEALSRVELDTAFSVAERLRNCPWNKLLFASYPQGARKLFFGKTKVCNLDTGFHTCTYPTNIVESPIVYFEYHNKPFDLLVEHAKDKMELRIESFDHDAVRNYAGRKGVHLTKYLLMASEDEYFGTLRGEEWKRIDSLVNRFSELGLSPPFVY